MITITIDDNYKSRPPSQVPRGETYFSDLGSIQVHSIEGSSIFSAVRLLNRVNFNFSINHYWIILNNFRAFEYSIYIISKFTEPAMNSQIILKVIIT